jgi:alanyl-tRNA synthetase
MTTDELRSRFLEFFVNKRHAIIPSASVIPENDPTVLFTTAGMHPLVPYLLGEKHPAGTRLANSQKCVRTGDIDEVGDNRHLTFFEMLGNWSLGDYFKKESIPWSFEFLTSPRWLNIDPNRIYVTVFEGDAGASRRGIDGALEGGISDARNRCEAQRANLRIPKEQKLVGSRRRVRTVRSGHRNLLRHRHCTQSSVRRRLSSELRLRALR